MNIEEGKAMNHLIHTEKQILRLNKNLEYQSEMSEEYHNSAQYHQ